MRLNSALALTSQAALLLVLGDLLAQTAALAQGTAFTYQGRLNDNGVPAAGLYDLRFKVFLDPLGNNQAGSTLLTNAIPVTNGLFMLTLDFGPGIFNGTNYWLEVGVRTNGAGAYVDLSPLQAVTPVPYAIFAENAVNGGLAAGTYTNAVILNNPADSFRGTFIGNGAGVSNVNALTLSGLGAGAFWQLGGNQVAPGQFIGTTNNQPVELWANQSRAFRLEPDTNNFGAPNVIGGAPNNFVDPGIYGATIAGGGVLNYTTNGYEPGAGSNHVSAIWGTISGGRRNTVAADHSIIGGGHDNLIQPFAYDSAIGGGAFNTISNLEQESVIAGGEFNTAGGFASTVSGGYFNNAAGAQSIVAGGYNNTIQSAAASSAIAGGSQNLIQAQAFNANLGGYNSTIAGGLGNTIDSPYATIGGGSFHSVGTNSNSGFIGGGYFNRIANNTFDSTIAGGSFSSIGTNSFASTISGGSGNSIGNNAPGSSVGGGNGNSVAASYATIAGGLQNTILSNAPFAAVAGGSFNVAGGPYSFAAGNNAQANHPGSFVWSDASAPAPFSSTRSNELSIRATGGVRLVTAGAGLTVDGEPLPMPQATTNDASHSNIVNVIEGSSVNSIAPGTYGATISGGGAASYFGNAYANTIAGDFGSIAGGGANSVQSLSTASSIGGGFYNTIQSNASSSTIAGGYANSVQPGAYSSTIAGGEFNKSGSAGATVGGGSNNSIGTNSNLGTIGGGYGEIIQDNTYGGTIGGGWFSLIGMNSYYATIGGGQTNSIGTNATGATIAGGALNAVQGGATYAAIPGGYSNSAAGNYSFAAGQQAYAGNDGSFVWADSQNAPFGSTGANQFLVRASGGVGVNTNNPAGAALNVAGTVRAASFQGDGSGLFNVGAGALGNYVFAYNSGLQSVATGNVFQDVVFATDAQVNGWTHTSGTSQYTNAQTGLYLVQYNADVTTVSGTNAQFRVTLNGLEIPGSRAAVTFAALNQFIAVSKSLIASANAGDVLTMQFTGSSSGVRLFGTANSTLTVTRIQ
ncbi:MAG TPA: hypothetical protein VNZ64_05870 [Candidatus Acidoferrum sp.]|jgi:hypothetical protein|nr:hypothetical protein [Candidatus Acidoferrum sp.]